MQEHPSERCMLKGGASTQKGDPKWPMCVEGWGRVGALRAGHSPPPLHLQVVKSRTVQTPGGEQLTPLPPQLKPPYSAGGGGNPPKRGGEPTLPPHTDMPSSECGAEGAARRGPRLPLVGSPACARRPSPLMRRPPQRRGPSRPALSPAQAVLETRKRFLLPLPRRARPRRFLAAEAPGRRASEWARAAPRQPHRGGSAPSACPLPARAKQAEAEAEGGGEARGSASVRQSNAKAQLKQRKGLPLSLSPPSIPTYPIAAHKSSRPKKRGPPLGGRRR